MDTVQISKPTLIIRKNTVLSNLRFMMLKAQEKGVELHPHYKTHQSTEVGFWAMGEGVNKITVSSLSMASKFIEQTYDEITVAFPFNRLEIESANRLAEKANIVFTVSSESAVNFLAKNLWYPAGIAIKIDTGNARAGINPKNSHIIEDIIDIANLAKNLNLHSFMAHTGHNYQAKDHQSILSNHKNTVGILDKLKISYGLRSSLGDTPGCTLAEDFGNTDILRPGNFIYYDLMQYSLNVCRLEDIAVSVMCPVVAKSDARKEVILYGGAIHFSKDYLGMPNGEKNFGLPVIRGEKDEIPNNCYIKSLSQEHGILKCSNSFYKTISEGDIIEILPVHSCLTANLLLNNSVII